jgi:hypothetical protein
LPLLTSPYFKIKNIIPFFKLEIKALSFTGFVCLKIRRKWYNKNAPSEHSLVAGHLTTVRTEGALLLQVNGT